MHSRKILQYVKHSTCKNGSRSKSFSMCPTCAAREGDETIASFFGTATNKNIGYGKALLRRPIIARRLVVVYYTKPLIFQPAVFSQVRTANRAHVSCTRRSLYRRHPA